MSLAVTPYASVNEFQEAVRVAEHAASLYYNTDAVAMSDADYDQLVERIAATVEVHPDWDEHGITTEVAAGTATGGEVTHTTPMLSLGKIKSLDQIEAWASDNATEVIVTEAKVDGLAVRAEYQDGQLVLAALRGNGTSGENVTTQLMRAPGVHGLPAQLNAPWTGEVRGEVFMTDADFDAANDARLAAGKPAFANPRNATSGSVRNLDREYEVPLSFAAYEVSGDQDSYLDRLARVEALGIQTVRSLTRITGTTVRDQINALEAQRATLGFPIDGAVVKLDSTRARDLAGEQSRAPRWAYAYKYAPDTVTTKLLDIEISIGRTGRLGFRLVLAPVFVGGTTVTYASGHNAPWLIAADLRPGDDVWVYRAGDVIPRVATSNLATRPADSTPWEAPEVCPQCGEPLDKTSLLWRCHTPTCSIAGALDYWASGDALDIDGIGTTICEALAVTGLATNVADLYDLTAEQWAALPLGDTATGATRVLGTANAATIVANLAASKNQPFNRVVTGLGIRMTGRSVGRWLASHFKTMDALRAATVDDIATIEKLGPIKAQHIVNGLAKLGPVIDRLAAHGLTMSVPETTGPTPFSGHTYVVSGSVPGYTRTGIAERIEQLGGKASSSVSKTTTALITSETTTSKAVKASQLGIPVIDPAEFAATLATFA